MINLVALKRLREKQATLCSSCPQLQLLRFVCTSCLTFKSPFTPRRPYPSPPNPSPLLRLPLSFFFFSITAWKTPRSHPDKRGGSTLNQKSVPAADLSHHEGHRAPHCMSSQSGEQRQTRPGGWRRMVWVLPGDTLTGRGLGTEWRNKGLWMLLELLSELKFAEQKHFFVVICEVTEETPERNYWIFLHSIGAFTWDGGVRTYCHLVAEKWTEPVILNASPCFWKLCLFFCRFFLPHWCFLCDIFAFPQKKKKRNSLILMSQLVLVEL